MRVVGEFVTELRVERGLSRIELARHLEVSYKTIFLIEEGKLEPDSELIERMIKLFEVTEEELASGRKHFNNDGSRAVPQAVIKKHRNAVLKYKRQFFILGIVAIIIMVLGFAIALYFRSQTGFILSLLIICAMLVVFIKVERKAIRISDNEMLSERVKFKNYHDIIKFTACVVCVGAGSAILSAAFSFFIGIFVKVISILIIIVVAAVVIYYTDRHLWGAERRSNDSIRHKTNYYNENINMELKALNSYIDSNNFLEDKVEDDLI